MPQFYQLGGLMIIATIIMFTSIALAAGILGNWLRSSHTAMLWMNRLAGSIFIVLAVKLAFAKISCRNFPRPKDTTLQILLANL